MAGGPLFVSVTAAPQAAGQVAQMSDGNYGVVLRRVGFIVMPFDGFGDLRKAVARTWLELRRGRSG